MVTEYQTEVGVDQVTGAIGPLYYAQVKIEGTPVEAMIDPGSSASIISFTLFKKIGKKAKVPSHALK